MALIEGLGLGDVRPLREPLAPPQIVLGDRVELGKVERQNAGERFSPPMSKRLQIGFHFPAVPISALCHQFVIASGR